MTRGQHTGPVPLNYAPPGGGAKGRTADWGFPLAWSALLVAGLTLFAGGLATLLAGADGRADSRLAAAGAILAALFFVARRRPG